MTKIAVERAFQVPDLTSNELDVLVYLSHKIIEQVGYSTPTLEQIQRATYLPSPHFVKKAVKALEKKELITRRVRRNYDTFTRTFYWINFDNMPIELRKKCYQNKEQSWQT